MFVALIVDNMWGLVWLLFGGCFGYFNSVAVFFLLKCFLGFIVA